MKKIIAISLVLGLFSFAVLAAVTPMPAAAEITGGAGMEEFTEASGVSGASLPTIIGRIVRIVISFLGLIAAVIIIVGGFQWMTSGGNEDKIAKAKKLMINGVIGMVLVVLAYAIATFIMSQIVTIAE